MPFGRAFPPIEHQQAPRVRIRVAERRDAVEWQRSWLPAFANAGGVHPDASWDWAEQIARASSLPGFECFAAEREGRLEGLLSLALTRSRLEPGREIVYVEYVGVAPWNQRALIATPLLRGIGTALLRVAASVSVEIGLEGALGLHSKPDVESFYRERLRLIAVAREVAEDGEWMYFEATPDVARKRLL